MTRFGFPRDSRSGAIGRSGESWFQAFVTGRLGWIYRSVHGGADFGIDGFVDVVENGAVTGRSFAVQIKCGDSYLRKRTSGGIKYDGAARHLNFYLNQDVPVVLVVLDEACSEGYWTRFEIERTVRSKRGWWIEVPARNRITEAVRQPWARIAGEAEDFSEAVEAMWAVDELLESSDYRTVAIPEGEITSCSMEFIDSLIARWSKTRDSLLRNRGMLNIFFPCYDSDPREVYEIPEVRQWFEASTVAGIPWFYFLDARETAHSIRLLLFSMCNTHEGPSPELSRRLLYVEGVEQANWMSRQFQSLNQFTTRNGIPLEINKERSFAVMRALGIPTDEAEDSHST